MLTAFAIIGIGVNATNALVMSQVVLSLALPLPMIALVLFTGCADIMGRFANSGATHIAAIAGTILVLSVNAVFILQTSDVANTGFPSGG